MIWFGQNNSVLSITFLVNTLRVAKPEKGQKIEAMLIQMAQTGQLGGRIGEDELIGLLGKINSNLSEAIHTYRRTISYFYI